MAKGLAKKITNSRGEEFCSTMEFNWFLKKHNCDETWFKLNAGGIDPDYFTNPFGGQLLFHETSMAIEHFCLEFKKEKQNQKPNDQERERERGKSNVYVSELSS